MLPSIGMLGTSDSIGTSAIAYSLIKMKSQSRLFFGPPQLPSRRILVPCWRPEMHLIFRLNPNGRLICGLSAAETSCSCSLS